MSIENNLAKHISDQATQINMLNMYLIENELIADYVEWADAKIKRMNIQTPSKYKENEFD